MVRHVRAVDLAIPYWDLAPSFTAKKEAKEKEAKLTAKALKTNNTNTREKKVKVEKKKEDSSFRQCDAQGREEGSVTGTTPSPSTIEHSRKSAYAQQCYNFDPTQPYITVAGQESVIAVQSPPPPGGYRPLGGGWGDFPTPPPPASAHGAKNSVDGTTAVDHGPMQPSSSTCMLGRKTLFSPGFDHTGISMQSVVEKRLFKSTSKDNQPAPSARQELRLGPRSRSR
ncbi:uncharacterized protein EV420DRAFT_1487601 [Desarmillaria tabescens]|uniref:Uncharacterized protein n=1 Tax=Armillaria tabescens TaxID=1929756 RepID=A0AA39MIP3_ARMTA|nr:uncharacterized protein EV420DRAFT_1487601 [Desarmillaria tabescens]KAK0436321.1 hypothetical protein EV420DRAFT_1487601 [Desarmillaria tabescens]